MTYPIRRLAIGDAASYRDLRLEALRDYPEAFSESVDEAEARPVSYWEVLVADDRIFLGAFDGDRLFGSVSMSRESSTLTRHRAWLLGMYVASEARGTGMADALIGCLVSHAKAEGILQLQLGVSVHNETALRLYERHGFTTYGREPRALRFGDLFIDEFLMAKPLDDEA
jgi:ribosomal protein S18 acetylase RimI-like enzyme